MPLTRSFFCATSVSIVAEALDKKALNSKYRFSMQATLLLNASYEPLRIISWQKALTLFFAGKVEIVEEYDQQIHSITFAIKLPSIIRLLKYVRVKNHNKVKFSRANIYARDDYTCQYCGKKFPSEDLTFDHVVPVARGWSEALGQYRRGVLPLQPQERRPHAGRSRHAPDSAAYRTALVAGIPRHLPAEVSAGKLAGLPLLEYRTRYLVLADSRLAVS